MYSINNYISRGSLYLRNSFFPKNKRLATLMLYATNLCNSKCKHCLVWKKKPIQNLSLKSIENIISSKVVSKNTLIGLEGGEFLLHPQADEIMNYLDKNHPKYELLSNCVQFKRTIKAIENYKPVRLFVSLDGKPETHQYMRGSDSYESVIEVIKYCKNKLPVSIMFTLTPFNSFDDLIHVCNVADKYKIDLRVGIYNNMPFFETADKAHCIKDNEHNNNFVTDIESDEFVKKIPEEIKNFKENFDFIFLYDYWRRGFLNLKCNSITDSIIILPNGDVPICQNLSVKLGNINENSLDKILNSKSTIKLHNNYKSNCNKCWINFHRKYDIILYRTAEKFLGKFFTKILLGNYSWTDNNRITYKQLLK